MSTDLAFLARPFSQTVFDGMLALNNQFAAELSFLQAEGFSALLMGASHVQATAGGAAFIVAFNDECHYENPNFHWLKQHYQRFYYIDRVVVGEDMRGRGVARQFYAHLEVLARAEGRERLVCEINAIPPNPISDGFHKALGFEIVGEQYLAQKDKTVRYWAKEFLP